LSAEKRVDKSNVLMLLHGEPLIVCTLRHYILSESTADWHHTWSSWWYSYSEAHFWSILECMHI